MRVRRTDGSGEMELSGTAFELLRLVEVILSGVGTYELDTSADPSPYQRTLSLIDVVRTAGKASIAVASNDEKLEIGGGADELKILASNIEGLASTQDPSYHLHIEYFPDHFYLSERSEPLVVVMS